jgi:lysozyme
MVTTVTDTYRTRVNTLFGVDLSQYQQPVDFQSLKNDGVKFAYLRAYGSTHSSTGDTMFEKYVTGASNVGMPTGSYYYAMPNSIYDYNDAKAQATQFVTKLKNGYGGGYGDLIPMVDVEDTTGIQPVGKTTLDMPVTDLLRWTNDFRNVFEDLTGVQLGLYTGYYFVNDQRNNFNEGKTPEGNILKDMPLWISMYIKWYKDVALCGGWTDWLMWQYNDSGVFAGIPNAKCDLDLMNGVSLDKLRTKKVYYADVVTTNEDTVTDKKADTVGDVTTTIITTTTTITSTKESVKHYI